MKYAADIITALRIAAAIIMLFTVPMSVLFFVLYTIAGLSDMIDGTVARKLGTAGNFGAKLDSIADLLFLISAAIKLLPVLCRLLPVSALWMIIAIAAAKCVTCVLGAVKFKKLCFLHTYMNKLTGAVVFVLPYFFRIGCFAVLIYTVCGVAFLAAVDELACVIKMKEYNPETRICLLMN